MHKPDPRDCSRAFRQLEDYLDRELAPSELEFIRDHLERCKCCASEFEFEGGLYRELKSKLARLQAPASLKERVLASLRAEQAEGTPRG